MPGNFQVICGSMVGENHRSPASTETLALLLLILLLFSESSSVS